MTSTSTTPLGYWAARLALFSLRAGLPKQADLDTDAFILAPSESRVTADAAARHLASLGKPLYCAAEARDRAVRLECGPLVESRLPPSHIRRSNVIGQMVRRRFGEPVSHLTVIWLGRGEQLNVSLADVEDFYRDYDCFPYGGAAADWVDSMFARGEHITPASAGGAVAVYKLFPVDIGFHGCVFRLPRWLGMLIVPKRLRPPGPPRDA